jgi:hypothetical protein
MATAKEIISREIAQRLVDAENQRQKARVAFEQAAGAYEKALRYSSCDSSGFHNFKDKVGYGQALSEVCTNCGWEHWV